MWEIYIHFSILLLALASFVVNLPKLQPELRLLGLTLGITTLIESYAAYLVFQLKVNLFLYHWLIPIQVVLFSLIFHRTLHTPGFRKLILFSIPVYLIFACYNTLYLQPLSEFNSYSRILKNILLTCWALFYYKELFAELKVKALSKDPMFWVSTGLLFASLGSFFSDGLMNHLLSLSFEMAHALNYINVFLKYFLNLTFLVAFWLPGSAEGKFDRQGIKA